MSAFFIIDVFTEEIFGGNPACIVFLEGHCFPKEGIMAAIAAEFRYSETAFVLCHSEKEYTLRFFTPRNEVNFCGHATLGAFHLLKYKCNVGDHCVCHTLAGDYEIECGDNIMIKMLPPTLLQTVEDIESVYRAIGVGVDKYTSLSPVKIVSTGLPDLMIQVSDIKTLNGLRLNMKEISDITEKYNAVSFHVFALSNDSYTAHVRNFAPQYGINEESGTGSSNASLTYYLYTEGEINKEGFYAYLQGEAMGRPSTIITRLTHNKELYIGGTATIVAKGSLYV